MIKHDKRGNPVSAVTPEVIERFDRACDLLHAYQADPLAEVDAILAEHPDFIMGHAMRAGALATTTDKAFEPEFVKSVRAVEALAGKANARELHHIAAVRAWAEGDWVKAAECWGQASIEYPRDLLALQLAHASDFFLGSSHMLRDRIARVLPHWNRSVPGYGFTQGMYAFGLEESGAYAEAEERGREAVALNKQDGWAVHAVAHVMEMQGRAKEGAAYLAAGAHGWEPGSMFAYHLWWHKALFHIDGGEFGTPFSLFDEKVSGGGFGQALELVDGSGLLWRLSLLGQDVGQRWKKVVDNWEARVDDGFYAFNDAFAMMAFVGDGRVDAQKRLLAAARGAANGGGVNAMMSREVGVPACEGFAAFGRGDHAKAIELLLPVCGKANRFGGSHAQRDIFSWTLTEAAMRLGNRALADAFVAERLAAKPESPINTAFAKRAASLKQKKAA